MRIRTIGMTGLLIMMAAPAMAQRGRRGPPGDGMRGAMGAGRIESAVRMRARLAVTEEPSGDEFRDAVRQRREAAPAAEDDPLSEMLTEDQVSQLDRAGRRGGMRGMRGFRGRGQMEFRRRGRGEFRGRGRTEFRRRGGPDLRDRRTP